MEELLVQLITAKLKIVHVFQETVVESIEPQPLVSAHLMVNLDSETSLLKLPNLLLEAELTVPGKMATSFKKHVLPILLILNVNDHVLKN